MVPVQTALKYAVLVQLPFKFKATQLYTLDVLLQITKLCLDNISFDAIWQATVDLKFSHAGSWSGTSYVKQGKSDYTIQFHL